MIQYSAACVKWSCEKDRDAQKFKCQNTINNYTLNYIWIEEELHFRKQAVAINCGNNEITSRKSFDLKDQLSQGINHNHISQQWNKYCESSVCDFISALSHASLRDGSYDENPMSSAQINTSKQNHTHTDARSAHTATRPNAHTNTACESVSCCNDSNYLWFHINISLLTAWLARLVEGCKSQHKFDVVIRTKLHIITLFPPASGEAVKRWVRKREWACDRGTFREKANRTRKRNCKRGGGVR